MITLTDPDAEPLWRYGKLWAQPIAEWFLSRPGNAVSATVSPETRAEVRAKVSRLVRGRWFSPPFSGARFSAMLCEALTKMEADGDGISLLPPRAATREHRVLGGEQGLPEVDSYEIVIVHRPTADVMVKALAEVMTQLLAGGGI